MSRLSKPTYFMTLATLVAKRSTCPRGQVGAVLVSSDDLLLSVGYNGSPAGTDHCEDVGCLKTEIGNCIRTVHAEINACLQAPTGYRRLRLFCTHHPCARCLQVLHNYFVTEIYYWKPYDTEPELELRHALLSTFARVSQINPEVTKLEC